MRPSARAVVHHVLYFADPNGRIHDEPSQGAEPGFSGMRAGGACHSHSAVGPWAAQPHFFPEGLALRTAERLRSRRAISFSSDRQTRSRKISASAFTSPKNLPSARSPESKCPRHYSLFSGLDIPAGEKDFVIRDTYTLPVAVDGVGVGAHAHYIAKQMKMTATLPDGEVKTLLYIKDWDFAWQDRLLLQGICSVPQGTRLDAEIHWDNSADNPHNPSNPPVRVTWGEESKDEMGSISLIAVAASGIRFGGAERGSQEA